MTEEERRSTMSFSQELIDSCPHLWPIPTRVWGVLSFSPSSYLQQLFKFLLEAVSQQIYQLAAGKVHPAKERELRITEQIEGVSSSLKHHWLCMLHHYLLELLQEQLQVLREKKVGETSVGEVGNTTLLEESSAGRDKKQGWSQTRKS